MARLRVIRVAAPVLVAVAIGGCGLHDPYRASTRGRSTLVLTGTTPSADSGDPAPERDGSIPESAKVAQSQLARGSVQRTPEGALERYAAMYLNWDAAHVARIERRLATISIDQARAQALQAAASAARDPELRNSHLANRGSVVAVSPGRAAAAGRWVIVTSEETSGEPDYQGLPPTLHIIYAQVTRSQSGWVVSEWAPQN